MNSRFIQVIKRAATCVAGCSMFVMMIIIFVEVISRSFFKTSTHISEDLASYCLGYAIYWGAIVSIDENKFLRIEILYEKFPVKVRQCIDWINDMLFACFIGMSTYFLGKSVLSALKKNTLSNGFYRWPAAYVRFPLLVGMILLTIYLICRMVYNTWALFRPAPEEYKEAQL